MAPSEALCAPRGSVSRSPQTTRLGYKSFSCPGVLLVPLPNSSLYVQMYVNVFQSSSFISVLRGSYVPLFGIPHRTAPTHHDPQGKIQRLGVTQLEVKIVSGVSADGGVVLVPIRVVASNPTGYAVRVETYVEVCMSAVRTRMRVHLSSFFFFFFCGRCACAGLCMWRWSMQA